MKIEANLFTIGTPFFVLVAAVYGWWTANTAEGWEPVGTLALLLTGMLVLMVGVYLSLTARRIDARPEDQDDAEIADAAGDQGVFAPWSWWPLGIAASAAIGFLAMAVGWWLMAVAVPIGIVTLVGWVFEYSRGLHAH